MNFRRILITVDSVPLALRVAETGLTLARAVGAEPILFHVVDPVDAVGDPDIGLLPDREMDRLVRDGEELLQHLVNLYGRDLDPAYFIARGKPADEIVQMVRDRDANLLVMGTHGRRGIARLLLQSVATDIIRHSPCPVMVVHDERA